eukprot:750781-Hanusia_phi.AAC.2
MQSGTCCLPSAASRPRPCQGADGTVRRERWNGLHDVRRAFITESTSTGPGDRGPTGPAPPGRRPGPAAPGPAA